MNTFNSPCHEVKPEKIIVEICLGTTCYLMGASDLQFLEEQLPKHLRQHVQVQGASCLGYCKDHKYGNAPYAKVDGFPFAEATVDGLVRHLESIYSRKKEDGA